MAYKITLGFMILLYLMANQLAGQTHEHRIASKIEESSSAFQSLKPAQLLHPLSHSSEFIEKTALLVSNASYFRLKPDEISTLLAHPPKFLKLELPLTNQQTIELQLFETPIFSPTFQVFKVSDRTQPFNHQAGAYYWGIVKNDTNSLAAISIAQGEVMGFVSFDGENHILGKLAKSTEGTLVFYKEKDPKLVPELGCFADEMNVEESNGPKLGNPDKSLSKCMCVYLEIDRDLVVSKGSVTQAVDFVNRIFSQVALLYANEGINVFVSEIKTWETADPYTGPRWKSESGVFNPSRI